MLVQSSRMHHRTRVGPEKVVTMRKRMNIMSERQAIRAQADREELAERIARALPREGMAELQPGLHCQRLSSPSERVHGVLEPSFCVIAQGRKAILLGEDRFR